MAMELVVGESFGERVPVLLLSLCGSAVPLRCGAPAGLRLAGGSVVRELPAIAQALAAAGGARAEALVGGTSAAGRAAVAQWLVWAASVLSSAGGCGATELAALDARTSASAFLAGARFSLADAACYYAAAPALHAMDVTALRRTPHLLRWADQVAAEISSRSAQGVPPPPRASAAALNRAPLRLYAGATAATESATAAPPVRKQLQSKGQAAVAAAAAAASAAAASERKQVAEGAAPATKQHAAKTVSAPSAVPAPAAAAAAAASAAAPSDAGSSPAAAGGSASKKEKKEKSSSSTAAPATPAAPAEAIAYCDLRVGVIVKVWPHPEADRLYCEEIDVGEGAPRQIASGLREHYTLESMQGRRVVVACNLKPRPLVGFTSNGMVLAATSAAGKVELLDPPVGAPAGERVTFEGHGGVPPAEPNAMGKKKWFDLAAEHLKVDEQCRAAYKGVPMMTTAGAVTVPSAVGGGIH